MLRRSYALTRFAIAAIVVAVGLAFPIHTNVRAQGGTVPNNPRLDFDGDGRTDWAVERNETPTGFPPMIWHLLNGAGYAAVVWGLAGDLFVPGDYDGDGKADIAVYRAGVFYARQSSTGTLLAHDFGMLGDPRTTGDYDGDGKDDFALFVSQTGVWWVKRSSDGTVVGTQFGQLGDKPAAGDYDGDGKADLAVVRLQGGSATYYIRPSSTGGFYALPWGQFVDRMVPLSDYDGDGKTDIAVVDDATGPSGTVQVFFVLKSSDGLLLTQPWGLAGDYAFAGEIVRLL